MATFFIIRFGALDRNDMLGGRNVLEYGLRTRPPTVFIFSNNLNLFDSNLRNSVKKLKKCIWIFFLNTVPPAN